MAEIANIPDTPARPGWKEFLEGLKAGTYLASAWACTGGALLASVYNYDSHLQLMGGAALLAYAGAKTGFDVFRQWVFTNAPPPGDDYSVYQHKNMSVHFREHHVHGAMTIGDDIFLAPSLLKNLTEKQREFLFKHEVHHVGLKDFVINVSRSITNNVAFPAHFIAITGAISAIAKQPSLSTAFAGVASVGMTSLFAFATRAINARLLRTREYECDRDALNESRAGPIAAIETIYAVPKILSQSAMREPQDIIEKLLSTYPTRSERAMQIVKEFNERHPEQGIEIRETEGPKVKGSKARGPSLRLDAGRFDGRIYHIENGSFFAAEPAPAAA